MAVAHRSRALVHGLLGVVLVAAPQAGPAAAALTPVPSQQPLRCEPPTLGRDKLTVLCALDAAAAPRGVHIKVYFTGSHDDTTASMEVAIGDAPIACDAGSKTSTESEDGDVTLDCRVTVFGRSGAATVLRASAKWFHAQYVGVEVDGRQP